MADPYSKQEIEDLRSPAVSWQYLDARRIVATWDALLAEKQAAIERLREALTRTGRTGSPWTVIDEALEALDATQHDGQALREVREEAWDACAQWVDEAKLWFKRAHRKPGAMDTVIRQANPHRQPQADHIPAAFKQPTPQKPRRLTGDEVRQIAEAEVDYQADHPTTTTTDESIQKAADDEYTGAGKAADDLTGADLRGANLRRAELTDADLFGADLTGADLTGANLRRAKLTDADLCDADLCDARLTGAKLRRALLRCADLTGADLRGADLRRADLRRADLTGANLYGANLTGADLTGAYLGVWERGPDGFAQRRDKAERYSDEVSAEDIEWSQPPGEEGYLVHREADHPTTATTDEEG